MPKFKTHRASAKRFKKTANGGLKGAHAFTSHRFHGKTKKQRRQLRGTSMMNNTTVKNYVHMLGR
ncbi:large subunit ribosomal protein L35 [Weissella uvarum]|uniref:50S ribosomal protein L35 n=1 Tax=Weissella uvarum TaxID=1479233 RepID=UPI0019613C52|nr:50S ribosomal protein L35 [Weissella uvarum]MBM7617981.1 large subunit ribosomal protein L35 [Weissella uvarum]MCM0596200.1 50S ribosomal protein L35 [Weissella uvarum]